jgi:protein involved in sex pheromone biosynthesis
MKYYKKGKFIYTDEVPKCLDKQNVEELRGFHRQIEKEFHKANRKEAYPKILWLVRHRNWFVQQNKNPTIR